eukprot:gnl/Hemi2/10921_TR3755_c0_g1_i1.p1 gnl/Hemi2/10921_TR3755_c0_g1~~gnl/Hemi2/10921_TR3755_c0_g1_i1.p1  ORF type:complete len:337 (-),score=137.09 gnl/Hemi2/10921_TR3755_c0_g1_i1:388-1398(-)
MILAGVNIFRLNGSHRQPGAFEDIVPRIREISARLGQHVEIMGDLQGPKFRCGIVDGGECRLVEGAECLLRLMENDNDLTQAWCITMKPTKEQQVLIENLKVRDGVLLNDGALRLEVVARLSPTSVNCIVKVGGILSSRKGINVPDMTQKFSSVTKKDYEDLAFYLRAGVDWIALSFVQAQENIAEAVAFMDAQGVPLAQRPKIMSKIETRVGLENIDEIVTACDGIMVARGDMGVEVGEHKVPYIQKMLIRKSNAHGKFVITATQMMESMINNPVPIRAEMSDLVNAVFDGSTGVMFSAETASGKHPVKVIEWALRAVLEAESHLSAFSPLVRTQ